METAGEKCDGITCSWWDNPARKKTIVKYETNDNIDDEVNEDEMYKIDITNLDRK